MRDNSRIIRPAGRPFNGEITVPGDKSISHRAVMFGAIAKGTTRIRNFLMGADCLSTIDCFRRLGVQIDVEAAPGQVTVHGRGLRGLKGQQEPAVSIVLDTGNSGTTTRLVSGILAGQDFPSLLSGDASLNTRPMKRIMEPLSQMGARIRSVNGNGCAPLAIEPGQLHGIHYTTKVASAQVKSAILLAGLYADSPTSVTEPALSRNHTELMLKGFGADVSSIINEDGTATASIRPCRELFAQDIVVPGDISSAAYFIAAALLVPGSSLLIKNVGINPTRAGFLSVCRDMGGDITLLNERQAGGEPSADLLVKHSSLHSVTIEGGLIPTLIDELPMAAVLAAFADGTTVIRDAAELKVKESDRIATVTANLRAMGCDVTPTDDGMIIRGGKSLHGAVLDSYLDHRIAMSFAVAGLAAGGETRIRNANCVDISFPGFYDYFN
ncbi:3-phosphoshikimate 1-carboxyvinyltransferase [Faecalicatena fissicatena]|uniref:3-phosphoshikimate 1-carboxyvinyltransferase n=1 Tax=Faecalicatena fissicatena TaxID=290055 RepID=A0ABS2E8Z7_9FIRM|nr:3-phosphoshikimate 1-carboxyvinyltransferase [Faecalicatena fissicatena]MBM6738121.1 3-phosphoshikimate 1-carboxyvinyltransferase [Faecalicatena fissicatena]